MPHYTTSMLWNMDLDTRYAAHDPRITQVLHGYPLESRLTRLGVAALPGYKIGMITSAEPSASELEQIVHLIRGRRISAIGWHGAGTVFDICAQRVHDVFGSAVTQSRIMNTTNEVRQVEDYLCGEAQTKFVLDELIAREHCGHFVATTRVRPAIVRPFYYPVPNHRKASASEPHVALVVPYSVHETTYPSDLIEHAARQMGVAEIHCLKPDLGCRVADATPREGKPPIRWAQIDESARYLPYLLSFAKLVLDVPDAEPFGIIALAALASGAPVLTNAEIAPGLSGHILAEIIHCAHLRNIRTLDSRIAALAEVPPDRLSALTGEYVQIYQTAALGSAVAAFSF